MDRSSPLSASPDSRHHSPPRGGVDRSSSPPRGLERGLIKLPEPLNNPHWRPPPDSRNPQWRRGEGDWRNGQNQGGAPSGWSGGPAQPPSSGWCSAPSTPSGPIGWWQLEPLWPDSLSGKLFLPSMLQLGLHRFQIQCVTFYRI